MNKEQHFYREDYYPVSPGMFLVCQENQPGTTADITELTRRDLVQALAHAIDVIEELDEEISSGKYAIERWRQGRK